MDQIARDAGIVTHTEDLPWLPLADGVEMQVLHIGDQAPTWSVLIRFEPGERLPAHIHLAPSEFLILEGSGTHSTIGPFRAGDHVFEHTGAYHPPSIYHEPTKLLMISYGPCSMLNDSGEVDFVLDTMLMAKIAAG
jgi:anti-sigma factor ChrR (cupin superfamily)